MNYILFVAKIFLFIIVGYTRPGCCQNFISFQFMAV